MDDETAARLAAMHGLISQLVQLMHRHHPKEIEAMRILALERTAAAKSPTERLAGQLQLQMLDGARQQ